MIAKKPLKRTPIRRVSKKRAKANRTYAALRRDYLIEHPFCQIYIKRFGLNEGEIIKMNGAYREVNCGFVYWKMVPMAYEIHHTKHPKWKYLNDTSTWLSACRDMHMWAHNHPSEAREKGCLV